MFVTVTLQTEYGPKIMAFPPSMEAQLLFLLASYIEQRKVFSVSYD